MNNQMIEERKQRLYESVFSFLMDYDGNPYSSIAKQAEELTEVIWQEIQSWTED